MSIPIHPSQVLYVGGRPFPVLTACEHFAGSEKLMKKALQIQAEFSVNGQSIFDITADCEDGAPAGDEREHEMGCSGRKPRAWIFQAKRGSAFFLSRLRWHKPLGGQHAECQVMMQANFRQYGSGNHQASQQK